MQNFWTEVTDDGEASDSLHGAGLKRLSARESVAFSKGHPIR
jgi:hypothetical protein